MNLSKFYKILCWAVGATLGVSTTAAATFPDRPVTVMVPYPAGGGTDALARKLARSLADYWKVPVVVENAGGAEGQIGTQRVLNAPADGYTLLFQISQMLLWNKTVPNNKIDAVNDFRYVSKIQTSPLVFGVSSKLPVRNFEEYVTWCKSNDCAWGSGSAYAQLIGKQLMAEAALPDTVNVPYRGTAPMMTDVLGSHIAMAVPAVTSSLGQIKGGAFRALAVGSKMRFDQLPDVPTLVELKYPVQGETWYGLLVAKKTPQPAFERIVQAVRAVSTDESLRAQIRAEGGTPVFNTPDVFQREVEQESEQLNTLLDRYWAPQK